ncbi:MAG: hypothetical protein WCB92_18035 [Mycobacterium sp.]
MSARSTAFSDSSTSWVSVSVINPATNAVIATIPVGSHAGRGGGQPRRPRGRRRLRHQLWQQYGVGD